MKIFDKVTPGFGPFSGPITKWVGILLALVWAFAFVYAGVRLLISIAHIAAAKKVNRPTADSTWDVIWPLGAVVGLVLVPVIWNTLIAT